MPEKIKIALIGRSGSGKTAVAKYLEMKYDFAICSTGKRCREIATEFFNCETKEILQEITDAFNKIEKGIWLKIAFKQIALDKNTVIDSLRFIEDYNFAKNQGFKIWKIDSPQVIRFKRLSERKQAYKIENEHHQSETELQNINPDFQIENSYMDLNALYSLIDGQISKL